MNPFSLSIEGLEKKARAIRRRIIVLNAESPAGGHTGADLSQVELLTALYFRILNCSPERKNCEERDIYIQSKGHAVGGYYCVLADAGYIPTEWLSTYQHADSHLPGHPVRHKTPGVNIPSIRPCNTEQLLEILKPHRVVVSVEEHNINGGVGSLVAEVLAEAGCAIPLRRLGIPDGGYAIAADRAATRTHHQIDPVGIVKQATALLQAHK